MRRLYLVALSLGVALLADAPPASSQAASTSTTLASAILSSAASALRGDPVYQHPDAELAITDAAAAELRDLIADTGEPVFVALLPSSAAEEAGGDANAVTLALADEVGFSGTYAVVVGNSFRAVSDELARGRAGDLATASFQARRDEGLAAVLSEFVRRVRAESSPAGSGQPADGNSEDGGSGGGWLLVLLGLGGAGLFLWRGDRRRHEEDADRRALAGERQMLLAETSVLADDVMALESQLPLHPEARPDYDAGVSRYRSAQAALEYAEDGIDLVRVGRVVAEGRYAMNRARARIEGREPPAPPPELRAPGRHDEPALDVDERGEPVYVNYGGPFYGGGWFGGGGGLMTGLFLGQMLGGWGGWGGWGHDHQDGDGELGGGDFGGGDFGGGDFGGGDFGGGDW